MGDGRWLALGAVAAVAVAGAVASSRRGASDKGKKRLFEVGGTCDFGPGRLNESCQLRVWVPEDVTDEDAVRDDAYAKFYEWIDEQGGSEPWGLYCAEIMRVSFRDPRRQGSRATDRDDWLWSAKTRIGFESFPGQMHDDLEITFTTDYNDPDTVNAMAEDLLDEYGQERFDRWRNNLASRQLVEEAGYEVRLVEGPTRHSFRKP